MTLNDFKSHVKSFPKKTKFKYSISNPFSWRGVYAEVAFSISKEESLREEILEKINKALSEKFYGYKGGEYRYTEYTEVNFESDNSRWSDGDYCKNIIEEIEGNEFEEEEEVKLIGLIFPKNEL